MGDDDGESLLGTGLAGMDRLIGRPVVMLTEQEDPLTKFGQSKSEKSGTESDR